MRSTSSVPWFGAASWSYSMSRYLLLVLINLPFIISGVVSATVAHKTSKSSTSRYLTRVFLWLAILTLLILAAPIYDFLFSKELTVSEPLSLFDVVQITCIIGLIRAVTQLQARHEKLEKRTQDLHQELSIILSDKNSRR